jgi:hypothetical protein
MHQAICFQRYVIQQEDGARSMPEDIMLAPEEKDMLSKCDSYKVDQRDAQRWLQRYGDIEEYTEDMSSARARGDILCPARPSDMPEGDMRRYPERAQRYCASAGAGAANATRCRCQCKCQCSARCRCQCQCRRQCRCHCRCQSRQQIAVLLQNRCPVRFSNLSLVKVFAL